MNRRILLVILVLIVLGITVGTAAAQNSYSLWFYNYWDNPNLEGAPVSSGSTGEINYDWGSGSPAAGVPDDHWSGQWTSYVEFSPGTYRIVTESDDGVSVFLGDKSVIYDWNKHPPTVNEVIVSLHGGSYSMAVSFFEDVGRSLLKVGWERIGEPKANTPDVTVIQPPAPPPTPPPPPSQGTWTANYWNNKDLSGNAVIARNEAAINNEWGYGSPAPGIVANDNFSARWTRSVYFGTGSYRFTAQHDDGMRVSVSGNRIIDSWAVQSVTTNSADVDLNAGTYEIVVEYFENTELATAKFWWETTSGGGSPPPSGVAATTTAYWLNFRAGPSTSYDILDVLPQGTTLPVYGRIATNRWIYVDYMGVLGWISRYYTTINGDLNSLPVTG
ncbi:MAG TPA: PA14 domain-containing protein [candidate division Zixibacteria bacterium]|nr:PA14 domain-containing protein [candidate division Zixibacteria bacterium]